MPELHPLERKTREAQPNLGGGHYSKCLPAWIARCCDKFNDPNGIAFDQYDTSALAHTLIAARWRNEKMAAEIERLREELASWQRAHAEIAADEDEYIRQIEEWVANRPKMCRIVAAPHDEGVIATEADIVAAVQRAQEAGE